MNALKAVVGLLTVFIGFPITFYLQYQILQRVDASELMMFLFWVNLPLVLLFQIVSKFVDKS